MGLEPTVGDNLKEPSWRGSFPGERQQPTAQLPQLLSQDVVFTGGRAAGRSAVAGHAERREENVTFNLTITTCLNITRTILTE